MPVRSSEDRARRKSKLPVAQAPAAESVPQPLERSHSRPYRAAPVANPFCLLPNSASARRGKAKMAPWAVLPGRHAEPLRAMWCEKPPAPGPSRPASRNKNDKAAANFAFDPALLSSPKKLRAFYAPLQHRQEFVAGSLVETAAVVSYSTRHQRKLVIRRATSLAFSVLLNAEIRK